MAPSRSPLNRQSIVEAMTELLGPGAVETGDEQLKAASVDRFRKYTSVHGIYDGPIPAAIVYPSSTAGRRGHPAFRRGEPRQPRSPHRTDRHRGRPGDRGRGQPRGRRVADERDPVDRSGRHDGHHAVRRPPAGTGGHPARPGPDHRAFTPVQAARPDGRPGRDPVDRPVLHPVRRHRGHGCRPGKRLPGRDGHPHQERAPPGRGPGHPSRRHRQRRRAVLHHRGDGQALPLPAGEQPVLRLPGRRPSPMASRLSAS